MTARHRIQAFTTAAATAALLAAAVQVRAGNLYDVANGDWTNTATWNTGNIPSAGDNVSITNGHYVRLNGDETIPSLNSFQVGGAANSALRFQGAASFTFTNHISLIGGGTVEAVTEEYTPYTFSGGIDVLGTNLLHVAWGRVFTITGMPVTCHSTNDTLQMASYTFNGGGKVVLGVASPAYTGRWEMLPSSTWSFNLYVNVDGGLGSGSVSLRSAGTCYLRFNASQTVAGPDIYIEGGVPVGTGNSGSLYLENASVAFPNNPLLTLKNANIWLNNSGSIWGSRVCIAAGTSGVGAWMSPGISGNISSAQSDGSSARLVFDNDYYAGGLVILSGANTDFHGVFDVRRISSGVSITNEAAAGAGDSVIQVDSGQILRLTKTSAADWTLTNMLTGCGTNQVEDGSGTYKLTAQGTVSPGTNTATVSTNGAGILTIAGALAFGKQGSQFAQLNIEIPSTNNAVGVDFDRLAVTKECTGLSNANLNINIPGTLSPSVLATQTFDVVTCANNLSGLAFNSVSWSNNWHGAVTYGNGYVRLSGLAMGGGTIFVIR